MSRMANKFQMLTDEMSDNNITFYLEQVGGELTYSTPTQRGEILANLEKLEEEISQLKTLIRANA